jgi:hypothetical protein
MPVERGPALSARSAIILALSAVFVAGVLFLFVVWLAGTGDGVEVQLGDDVFDAGRTERIAAEIADRGPILYSDVAGGTRDLYLNHLSEDPTEGWVAFAAQQPGAARDCFLEWQPDEEHFVDTCDDAAVFPPDGGDQPRYEVFLEEDDERIVIDINGVRSTTSAPD